MDVKQKGLLRRMFDLALNELSKRSGAEDDAPYSEQSPARAPYERASSDRASSEGPLTHELATELSPGHEDRSAHGQHSSVVFVHGDGGDLRVRWRIAPEHVQRAGAIAGDAHVPCLRLIYFSSATTEVLREVQDRPNAGVEGECEVREVPERLIATYGLRSGERFVSVAHAVL